MAVQVASRRRDGGRRIRTMVGKVAIYVVMAIFSAAVVYPLVVMVFGSFKTQFEFYSNPWDCFWRVTLPLLRPILMINVTLATLGAFNVFDLVYVMTTGGPAYATNVAMMNIYTQAFQFYRFGYAAAMSFVLLALVSAIALVVLRTLSSERYF